ncbi:hypothetical protein R6Q59_007076 [Mikania micrantha]
MSNGVDKARCKESVELVEDINSKYSNRGKTDRVEERSSGPSKVEQKKCRYFLTVPSCFSYGYDAFSLRQLYIEFSYTGKEKMYETETEGGMVVKQKKKQTRVVHESSVNKKWMVLNTRSSPAQLFRCVKLLRDNQRESVKRMGFARLLNFNLNGIPSRLAHFVVDRLKPKRMEIVCRGGTLRITPGLIHKLWGIPIGGIQVESIVPLETYDLSVSDWRSQFEGRLLATRTLVKRIESAEDEDTFDFRMNFICCL